MKKHHLEALTGIVVIVVFLLWALDFFFITRAQCERARKWDESCVMKGTSNMHVWVTVKDPFVGR